MKLKQRVVISCVGVIVCFGFIIVLSIPELNSAVPNFLRNSYKKKLKDEFLGSHISAARKRLNKSNFTSEDFSDGKDTKYPGDDENENMDALLPDKGNKSPTRKHTAIFSNHTDKDVDNMLISLQQYQKSNFDFDKIRKQPYMTFLKSVRSRSKGKGKPLNAFKNLMG